MGDDGRHWKHEERSRSAFEDYQRASGKAGQQAFGGGTGNERVSRSLSRLFRAVEVCGPFRCVLFLAQFMHCGGRVPDMPSLNEAFDKVHIRAVKLCRSLARLRNKELSLDVFEGRFKQAAILCHCLSSRKETETDVFGLKSPLTKNDIHLPGLLRHFVSDYIRFCTIL